MEILEVTGKMKDETGKTYDQLYVVGYVGRSKGKAQHPLFLCKCSCGKETVVIGSNLRRGHTTSCGHDKLERMHKARDEFHKNNIPTDLDGTRFGSVIVKGFNSWRTGKEHNTAMFDCVCDCGVEFVTRRNNLSDTSSCGCKTSERISKAKTKHGMYGTPTYKTWKSMRERCSDADYANKKYYSDEGITVCEEWNDPDSGFDNFYRDMGERPEGHTLNRIEGAMVYSKDTCEWSDMTLQAYDKRKGSNNTTGRVGVMKKGNGLYVAKITHYKKTYTLADNVSFEEACKARTEGEIKFYGFSKENR